MLQDKRDVADEEENIQRFTTLMYRAPEMADVHARMLIGPPGQQLRRHRRRLHPHPLRSRLVGAGLPAVHAVLQLPPFH